MLHPAQSSGPHRPPLAGDAPRNLRTAAVCRRLAKTFGAEVCVVIASRSVSTRHRVHATDANAAWLDDRQFVLGQGPTVDALTTKAPVSVPDTEAPQVATRWPGFAQEITGHPVRAIFAFPLLVGDAALGTVQIHVVRPRQLTAAEVAAMPYVLAELIAAVLDDHTDDRDVVDPDAVAGTSFTDVAMAVGMVAVQLGTTLPAALARLRGTAYTTDRPLSDVAEDVLHRRLHYRTS